MKKIATFCVSLAFFLGMSSGVGKAALVESATDLGMLSTTITTFGPKFFDTGAGWSLADTFADYYFFTVPSPLVEGISTSFISSFGTDILQNISFFKVEAFKCLDGVCSDKDSSLGTLGTNFASVSAVFTPDFFPGKAEINFTLSGLVSGTQYLLGVTGKPDGTIGGNYDGAVVLVPLPPAAALFLSALAGLAGFSRIRRRKAETT